MTSTSDPTSRTDDEGSVVVVSNGVSGTASPTPAEENKEDKPATESAATTAKDKPEGAEEDKPKDEEEEAEKKNKDEDEEKKEEKVVMGMTAEPKNLYQHIDRYNKPYWSDKLPDDLVEAAENEETQKFSILVRNKRSYDSRKTLEIDSIVVQSPLIKNLLRDVLESYPGVTTTLNRLSFAAPFRPFVHRWEEFSQACFDEEKYDAETRKHTKLLYDVLKEELKDVIACLEDYIKNKVVSYEHIWTIFLPESIVFSSRYGHPLAVKLTESAFTEHPKLGPCFMMQCVCVDYDGYKFGNTTSMLPILPFSGTIPITALDSFPMAFHEDAVSTTASLLERGRKFEKLAGTHYQTYSGNAIEMDPNCGPTLVNCDSRVVVDSTAYCKTNPEYKPQLKPLKKVEISLDIHAKDDDDAGSFSFGRRKPPFDFDPYGMPGAEEMFLNMQADGSASKRKHIALTEEQLILCTPMVRGFSLKEKKWLQFFVTLVDDIQFNDQAFSSLVLPEGHKSLILAFAQSQVQNKNAFDDVIQGKGKGIIMLLSGGPGIGKTLTAESVAEAMRVPLYSMGSGDIGTASWEVENKLTQTLELVAKWNAVLLLDECDVFLEERSTHDLDRNKIVSIFLRTLEYYEGIMFLTTNRVQNIDPAFDSRIHISLEYPDLDETARRAVWKGFLDRSVGGPVAPEKKANQDGSTMVAAGEAKNKHNLADEHINELAKLNLNGRIIKNVLKTSSLLAAHRGQELAYEHVQTVLKVGGHIDRNARREVQKAEAAAAAAAKAETGA
ncbi:P-loop containing nucleoside triphosphate hydrolase protein [Zalerion maritima]|uniref:P-loop containing nucleoside triphosphate hydrolase protein n=1 Tax=Zalerion maritima TaxID=339359 RepID=A0AAD5RXS7_9PEZI|nr:P-loop containing nucleoside triphosphate hydrolase protein [Zalerion maritima]